MTIIIIITIMVIMIKIILIIVVVIMINIPFQPGDFSTGFTTADRSYSVSDIPYQIEYIKKHETLKTIFSVHVCINRINKKLKEQQQVVLRTQTEDLYNLIEYSSNYSETTGSLWFCSKDEATDFNAGIANTNDLKSFKYKAKLLGSTEADNANGILKNGTIAVPLNYVSIFWRSLEMPLINCKVKLKIKWTKYCALSAAGADNVNNRDSDNNIFTIKDTKLYIPVVTSSARADQKLTKLLSKRFERSVYCIEYKKR